MGVRFSTVADGSFAPDQPDPQLAASRRGLVDLPWSWVRQVHGAEVVVVTEPGSGAGREADALVTDVPGAVLAVYTADCAPVALTAPGVVGIAHAGWRGLVAGVLQATVGAMRDLGAGRIEAQVGPCIRARCYEFGVDDLALATSRLGRGVAATTAWGTPALDVTAGVVAALAEVGVDAGAISDCGICTACSPVHFSHRARADAGRLAGVVWR